MVSLAGSASRAGKSVAARTLSLHVD